MSYLWDYIHVWGFVSFLLCAIGFNLLRERWKKESLYACRLRDFYREQMFSIPTDPEIKKLYREGHLKQYLQDKYHDTPLRRKDP